MIDSIFQSFDKFLLSKLDVYLKLPILDFNEQLGKIFIDSCPQLNEMLQYPYLNSGKRFRSILVLMSTQIWNLKSNKKLYNEIIRIAISIEMIHIASLIHDDVYDKSSMRRGFQSYHTYWGELNAVLLGDFFFTKAFTFIAKLENNLIIKNLSKTVEYLCKGELIQNLYRNNFNIKLEDYLKIIQYKTACLIGESCRIGLGHLNEDREYIQLFYSLGLNLGMAFQIIDDYLDFNGDKNLGKPLMQDFFNGYYNLPVLFLLKNLDSSYEKEKMIEQLENFKKNNDQEGLHKILIESKSFEKSITLAKGYLNRAFKILNLMKGKMHKDVFFIFKNFLKFTLYRKL